MAQMIVRGIDDEVMRRFKERAKKQGKSAEQAVRELIEKAAEEEYVQSGWFRRAEEFREQMRRKYGDQGIDSAELIREDRDSR
jgi:plasmid stability protein